MVLIRGRGGASLSPAHLLGRAARRPAGGRGVRLVGPGALSAPLTLSRAHSPGTARATALGADGVTWQEFAANVPRFTGPAQRLLLGGARTNQATNPRAGVSGGAAGNNLVASNSADIPRMIADVSISKHTRDTATGDTNMGSAAVGSMVGQPLDTPMVQTIYVYLPSSVEYGASASLSASIDNGAVTGFAAVNANFALRDQWQRIEARFLTRTSDVNPGLILRGSNFNNGAFFYSTLPQREYALFASSPILPAVGNTGASTRGADIVTAPLASLGIGANGACTILGTFMVPQQNPSTSQRLLSVGTDDQNVYFARVPGGATTVDCGRNNGGGLLTSTAVGFTLGTPFRVGLTIDGAGRVALSLNGGAIVSATGGPTSGLTTFRVGSSFGAAVDLFGEVGTVQVLPYAVTDAELQALVNGLSL